VGLEPQPRPRALGRDLAAELDPHRSCALADVDALERVARMPGDPLVLLVPAVEGGEVELTLRRSPWMLDSSGPQARSGRV
jgi:hypothetical protein